MNRVDLKLKAKEFAFKNKWNIWMPVLVIGLISFVVGFLSAMIFGSNSVVTAVIEVAFSIATIPLGTGYVYYLIKLVKGQKMDVKEALLSKYNIFGLIFVTALIVGLLTSLWSILLVVPGIIYAFKMSMVNFILADDGVESMTNKEIRDKSQAMMEGHKMEYFILMLSFIGWFLLGAVTLGIAYIWVIPYMSVTTVLYYQYLLDEYNAKNGKN